MDDETKKLIQEQYAKLPKPLQDAIQSAHIHELITAIGTASKLHIDQMGELENEVMMLMMGFTDPIEFVGELQKNLGLTAEVALKIATDTNEQILLPIRERMEHADDATAPSAVPSNPPAMSTAPAAEHAAEGKSVVMPSAAKTVGAEMSHAAPAANPVTPAPVAPQPTAPATAMFTIPAVSKPVELDGPHVDAMLSQPTVSIAPLNPASAGSGDHSVSQNYVAKQTPDIKKSDAPAAPPIYKTDPYHEPID